MTRELSRRWQGTYEYDPHQDLPEQAGVSFIIDFSFKSNGLFDGEIVEELPGIPELATIEGSVQDDRIQFAKTYKSMWIFDPESGSVALPEQPSQVIEYCGILNRWQNRIEGSWRIKADTRIIDDAMLDFPEITGTWTARAAQ